MIRLIAKLIFLLTFLMLFFPFDAFSVEKQLALELQDMNLPDVIRLMAKMIPMNIVISSSVSGRVTLHLKDAEPSQAFDLLLTSHGLAKWRMGNVFFIATQEELIKRKQAELKWREIGDESSPLSTKIWQINYAKVEDMAHLVQDEHNSLLSKRGHVRFDTRTNVLCVQDIAERILAVHRLIQRLDVPVQQILIEARLASVDSDYERDLGIQFTQQGNEDGNSPATNGKRSGQYSLVIAKLADSSLLDVRLSALEHAGRAELISNPSLFTANQQPASIESGEEVPYQEVSESGATAVVFKKAVLSLKVTPQILPGNKVLLALQVNQDKPSSRMVLGVPTISTRQIVTSVLANNAQTIVLGGIFEANSEIGQERLPFMSHIPLIGWLFQQHNVRNNKRELLIFVTPKIISDASHTQKI